MSTVRFNGVAHADIQVGQVVSIEMDTRTGTMTVHAARIASGVHVDESKGEWRCRCPPDPHFDTSVNLACFAACGKCGARRPERRGGTE